jgi:hypothetical protein
VVTNSVGHMHNDCEDEQSRKQLKLTCTLKLLRLHALQQLSTVLRATVVVFVGSEFVGLYQVIEPYCKVIESWVQRVECRSFSALKVDRNNY